MTEEEMMLKEIEDVEKKIETKKKEIEQLKKTRKKIYEKYGMSIYGFHNLSIDVNKIPELKKDLKKANSFSEIAKKYNVHVKTVQHWVRRFRLQDIYISNKKLYNRNKIFNEHLDDLWW